MKVHLHSRCVKSERLELMRTKTFLGFVFHVSGNAVVHVVFMFCFCLCIVVVHLA